MGLQIENFTSSVQKDHKHIISVMSWSDLPIRMTSSLNLSLFQVMFVLLFLEILFIVSSLLHFPYFLLVTLHYLAKDRLGIFGKQSKQKR